MKLYSLVAVVLALSPSVASAQESLTDPSSPATNLSPSRIDQHPPAQGHHKCPTVTHIVCLPPQCKANDGFVIWSSDPLSVSLTPPYIPEGIVSQKNSLAPGGGNIVLNVTGCQYHDSSKNKTKFILNVPQQYGRCTGIKGEFEMDCRRDSSTGQAPWYRL